MKSLGIYLPLTRLPLCFMLTLFSILFSFRLSAQIVASPVPSTVGGIRNTAVSVSVTSATPNADIRYTLNGAAPDSLTSSRYLSPLLIDRTTTLRLKAFSTGLVSSPTITHTYLFNANHTVPVVAFSFKDADFFDPTTGIYTNFTNNLEVPTNVEFFEKGATTASMSQITGVTIQGTGSATLPQKSFDIRARAALGGADLTHPFFPNLPYTKYKRIVIRNGGQDQGITMFRDAFVSSLATVNDLNGIVRAPDMSVSETRPSVLYLNGAYWGIYDMHERMKSTFVEQHFNLAGANYVMMENETEVINGDSLSWEALILELKTAPVGSYADNARFDGLKQQIEIQNFLDYNVFNVYIDNEDWPGNNVRRFRPRAAGGKWRWISYDFDFTFGLYQVTGGWNTGDATPNALQRLMSNGPTSHLNPTWATLVFRKCMENQAFRRDFINRTADMMNTVFKPSRLGARLDAFKALYEPEIARHVSRWGSPYGAIWQQNMDKIRSFSNNRPAAMLQHVQQVLPEVTGTATVQVSVSPAGAGAVQFSTLNLTSNNLPFAGTYFKGVPIPVTAVAAPGFVFSRWSVPTLPATPNVNVTLTSDLNLVAIFAPTTGNPCDFDTQAPLISNCPANQSVTTNGVSTCAVVNWTAPTATDNCSTPTVTGNTQSGLCFPIGTYSIVYTARDARNNTATCNFTVQVSAPNPCTTDTQAPVFSNCPANQTITTTSTCGIANWTPPTATDNCTPPTVTSTATSGFCFPLGTNSVVYTARDARNNTATCSFTVQVNPQGTTGSCKKYTAVNTNNICGCNQFSFLPYGTSATTATLKGTFADANSVFSTIDIQLAGGTSTPPAGAPFRQFCMATQPATGWFYYPQMTGTYKTGTNAPLSMALDGTPFQIGIGAGQQRTNVMGASGKFIINGTQRGVFNLELGNEQTLTCGGGTTGGTADIQIGITSNPPTYKKFTTQAFQVTAQNLSTSPVSNVVVEFKFPQGTSSGGIIVASAGAFVSYCAGGVLCYQWTIPTLAASSTATLSVPLFVLDIAIPIVATTRLLSSTPTDNVTTNNQATITINPAPVLALAQRRPTQLVPVVIQKISPNPTDSEIRIELESLLEKEINFELFNALGERIKVETRAVEKGKNRLSFDVFDFEQGVFYIVPVTNIGRGVPTKFVKM
jgi:hypothetical protein